MTGTATEKKTRVQIAREAIVTALAEDAKFFDIEDGEVLDNSAEQFSCTVSVCPRDGAMPDSMVIGGQHPIQVNIPKDGEPVIELGEGDEVSISMGRIYAVLYWSEAVTAI